VDGPPAGRWEVSAAVIEEFSFSIQTSERQRIVLD
jgi:hypothetical protein